MSLDRLPDEVLAKILRLALTSDKPITTSIKAYNIYQTYIDCIALSSGPPRNHTDLNKQLSERSPRRELPISPFLLGTSRRCYRLGSPPFYSTNTFIIMHSELGPFAKQIGFHNSKSIRSVELTIHHKDLTPIPKISLLNKGYYRKVENVKVILSKRHKIHKNGLTASQKAQQWTSVRAMIKKKGRELRDNVEMQKRQGAGWKFAGKVEWAVVHLKADHGILSAMCALERLPMPRKVWTMKNNKSGSAVEGILLPSKDDAVLRDWEVDVPEGSVVSEDMETREGSKEAAVIETGPPTPGTRPEIMPEDMPEPGNVVSEETDNGEGSMETANLDTGLPTPEPTPMTAPYTAPEPTAEPTAAPTTEMVQLPDWCRQI
jgi:hypothetical protein